MTRGLGLYGGGFPTGSGSGVTNDQAQQDLKTSVRQSVLDLTEELDRLDEILTSSLNRRAERFFVIADAVEEKVQRIEDELDTLKAIVNKNAHWRFEGREEGVPHWTDLLEEAPITEEEDPSSRPTGLEIG